MYEFFEHTADIGLRIRATTLPELFNEAARGLFSLIVENPEVIQPADRRIIHLKAESVELLFFDWLDHLLYVFDAEHLLCNRFDVTIDELSLTATLWGERLDLSRHVLAHEVKAITYHDLKLKQIDGEWLAEVILDI
jgi:SHS2 domain-containing protein